MSDRIVSAGGAGLLDHAALAAKLLDASRLASGSIAGPVAPRSGSVTDLVQRYHASGSAVEQGAILRSLDTASGSRAQTTALLAGGTGQAATGGKAAAPAKYDASTLYGQGGPSINDIRQTSFGDCYYVGVLAAMADKRPGVITNAISYDAKTGSFNVKLYGNDGKVHVQNVTQAEIDANINMHGGSARDDAVPNAPMWPDVMEVAYAKQLDTNHADGIGQGYNSMIHGGDATQTYRVLTGKAATSVGYEKTIFQSEATATNLLGTRIQSALQAGKPVTMDTKAERDDRGIIDWLRGTGTPTQDGLADSHTYTVTGMSKDKNGEWQVTLRNPWGQNMNIGEGHDTSSATITVPLSRLVSTEGLSTFDVGK